MAEVEIGGGGWRSTRRGRRKELGSWKRRKEKHKYITL